MAVGYNALDMESPRQQLVFILVRSQFASNLGSAVRIMKNMGFEELMLVQPECEVGVEARTRAMKGAEILDKALLLPSLEAVRQQVDLLAGTSGRFAEAGSARLDVRTFAETVVAGGQWRRLAIAFGPEDNGLSRQEIALCNWVVHIPTASDYGVINLAQAVAIVAHELRTSLRPAEAGRVGSADPASVQNFLESLEERLHSQAFPQHVSVQRMVQRIRRMASRTRLEEEDLALLRSLMGWLNREDL